MQCTPPLTTQSIHAIEMRWVTDSCTAKSAAGTMPVPARVNSAVPPEPVGPAVRCACPKAGLQPCALAVLVAVLTVASVCSLCSWRKRTSAFECARHFSTAVVQQFGFQVSSAQSPRWRHQLSSFTEAVGGTRMRSGAMNGGELVVRNLFPRRFFLSGAIGPAGSPGTFVIASNVEALSGGSRQQQRGVARR